MVRLKVLQRAVYSGVKMAEKMDVKMAGMKAVWMDEMKAEKLVVMMVTN